VGGGRGRDGDGDGGDNEGNCRGKDPRDIVNISWAVDQFFLSHFIFC
jgi:hypothetical protein